MARRKKPKKNKCFQTINRRKSRSKNRKTPSSKKMKLNDEIYSKAFCKASNSEDINQNKEESDGNITAEKKLLVVRRHEEFHDTFLSYEKILQFLFNIKKNNPGKIDLVKIGNSTEGKPILMVIIMSPCPTPNNNNPKMGTFIEAGLNGLNRMAVSNALYIIDYLVKNPNYVRIMDYYIVPCSNPDGYESGKKAENSSAGVDLSLNFPLLLGINDMKKIPTDQFLVKLKHWKENYVCTSPETQSLLKAIITYQFAIKLLISLQEGGETICYPYGFSNNQTMDINDVKNIAKKGRCAINGRCFEYGTLYDVQGLTYGSLIDFLRFNRSTIKYAYVIQVHKKTPRYSETEEMKHILRYGNDIMCCVKRMSCAVYKFYTDFCRNKNVETKRKAGLERKSSF